jgi:hypothetical protein
MERPASQRLPGELTLEMAATLEAGGLRAAELDRLCAQIPEDHLRLQAFDQPLPADARKLPDRAAPVLAKELAYRSYVRMSGDTVSRTQFHFVLAPEAEKYLAPWTSRFDWSADASAISRIYRRGREGFDSFIDPKAQSIILAERAHPLPKAVARQIHKRRGEGLMERLEGESIDLKLSEAVKAHLAETIPTPALALLVKAGIRLHVEADAEELNRPPKRMRAILGDELAKCLAPYEERIVGSYYGLVGELKLHLPIASSTAYAIGTARHELCHALDHVLGHFGGWHSETKEFLSIYEELVERAKTAEYPLAVFPTPYAATNPKELFAESATIYLDRYHDDRMGGGGAGDYVATREDLLQKTPRLYAFMEKTFTRDIPDAVEGSRVREHSAAVGTCTVALNELPRPGWTPNPRAQILMTRACILAVRGRLSGDESDERAALHLARSINRPPYHLLWKQEAAEQLASRLEQWLGRGA